MCKLRPQSAQLYLFDHMIFHLPVTLPTPTVSARDNTVWILSSLDGSRVERYIVEFECSVQNITFIEKYMSVGASGGTGQVSTNASCFGGLGQLYRVKVWAVSGPSISRALVCIPDGQCREEGTGACVVYYRRYGRYTMTCSRILTIVVEWSVRSALSLSEVASTYVILLTVLIHMLRILIHMCSIKRSTLTIQR